MILIGMFDSPFVRRVAVSMNLMGLKFEHRNWSVGKDADRIREYHPQGRVPALVLDSGEVLVETYAILDYLDELAGPDKALLPATGESRRRAQQLSALCVNAIDKGILPVYERIFRPAEKRHQPWVDRCVSQMHGSLALLEKAAADAKGQWLVGNKISNPDIAVTCVVTYLTEAAGLTLEKYPALAAHVKRSEALPEFKAVYAPFFAPQT